MKVTVEYVALLNVQGVANGETIEMAAGSTIFDLLSRLGIERSKMRFVVPLVNSLRVRHDHELRDGDRVYLLVPAGGG